MPTIGKPLTKENIKRMKEADQVAFITEISIDREITSSVIEYSVFRPTDERDSHAEKVTRDYIFVESEIEFESVIVKGEQQKKYNKTLPKVFYCVIPKNDPRLNTFFSVVTPGMEVYLKWKSGLDDTIITRSGQILNTLTVVAQKSFKSQSKRDYPMIMGVDLSKIGHNTLCKYHPPIEIIERSENEQVEGDSEKEEKSNEVQS